MKKISIIFAVLAIFMLLASCSNAAGKVDLAGNPVELTGTWEGSVAYKGDLDYFLPLTGEYTLNGSGKINGYTDDSGTYTYQDIDALSKDTVSTVTNAGTTTTINNIYNGETTTTTYTVVINADGSSTVTKVVASETKARASITVPTNNVYNVYVDGAYDDTYYATEVIPEVLGGTFTTTTTYTRSVPVVTGTNLVYDTTESIIYTVSGTLYSGVTPTPSAETETGVVSDTDCIPDEVFPADLDFEDDFIKTVEPTLEPVSYSNDILETVSFVVANDGTYTLTTTIVETQAARDAAAATETNYAVPALEAATKTVTYSFTGTVAAWVDGDETVMAMSSTTKEVTEETEGEMYNDSITAVTQLASRFAAPGEKYIRFFNGKKDKKDDVAKTRMYVKLDTDGDSTTGDECVIILDKAEEEEE